MQIQAETDGEGARTYFADVDSAIRFNDDAAAAATFAKRV